MLEYKNDNQTIKAEIRKVLIALYGEACFYCGKDLSNESVSQFTIDHFIPTALYGSDVIDNLRPCCLDCNTKKNSYDCGEWARRIEVKMKKLRKALKESKQMSDKLKALQADYDKRRKGTWTKEGE